MQVVGRLVRELYPGRGREAAISLDTSLEKTLGFDSLGRMELLLRLEQRFKVSLPEALFATADTPRELLQAIHDAAPQRGYGKAAAAPVEARVEQPPIALPTQARTLQDILAWHVKRHEARTHIYLYEQADEPARISYGALHRGAHSVAAGLRARGIEPGQAIALMLPTSRDYFFSFFGILLAGGVPVPVYPPARPSQIEDHLLRHARILANAEAVMLITVAEVKPMARLLKSQAGSLRRIATFAELTEAVVGAAATPEPARGKDLAFLQYTSGSTGQPKGVMLSHANLLANLRAMGAAVSANCDDVFVSWLPLYHDMGLIGAWFGSLYYAFPLVSLSPIAFLAHPQRWLWTIHRHRGTLSAAPNFAYELCVSKLAEADLQGLDLSSWRLAFNGAEPVSPTTVRLFYRRFRDYGLRPNVQAPVYGLAESSVGLAFPPLGREPPIDRIQRETFELTGEAVPADPGDSQALEFVACGRVLAGHQIRILDAKGRELPERHQGRLQFRGPSATRGYFRNPEATEALFDGTWLDSGDLAYLAEQDLYLTSRVKDLIIRAGRNIYPYEVEEAVGDIPAIRKGCVALFGVADAGGTGERLVVVAETGETDAGRREALKKQVLKRAAELLETMPDEVIIAPPHSVLKTSSGKLRRAAMRELYRTGRLGQEQRPVWQQLMRVFLVGVASRWRRICRALPDTLYGLYAWVVLLILATPAWLLILLVPFPAWRWTLMRGCARLLVKLTGTRLRVTGLQNLPRDRSWVLVCNHASYLDGLLVVAALPRKWCFVAKAELRDQFIAGTFLKRIGCEFIERFDYRKSVESARKLAASASGSLPLFYFPEGTFRDTPGLLPFHMGAFMNAVAVGVPVVPVIIRGSRQKLRGARHMLKPGGIDIEVAAPLEPALESRTDAWEAALDLRDRSRAVILNRCGEPDRG